MNKKLRDKCLCNVRFMLPCWSYKFSETSRNMSNDVIVGPCIVSWIILLLKRLHYIRTSSFTSSTHKNSFIYHSFISSLIKNVPTIFDSIINMPLCYSNVTTLYWINNLMSLLSILYMYKKTYTWQPTSNNHRRCSCHRRTN